MYYCVCLKGLNVPGNGQSWKMTPGNQIREVQKYVYWMWKLRFVTAVLPEGGQSLSGQKVNFA